MLQDFLYLLFLFNTNTTSFFPFEVQIGVCKLHFETCSAIYKTRCPAVAMLMCNNVLRPEKLKGVSF